MHIFDIVIAVVGVTLIGGPYFRVTIVRGKLEITEVALAQTCIEFNRLAAIELQVDELGGFAGTLEIRTDDPCG